MNSTDVQAPAPAIRSALGLIPARGGSKGVPRKNVRPLAGRPLLDYTVEAARGSRRLSEIVLTTEDEEIARIGRGLGLDVPFLHRPARAERPGCAGGPRRVRRR